MSRRIVVEFLGKDSSMSKTASAVEKQFGKTGASLDKLGMAAGKVLAGGLALGGAAIVKFGTDLARIEKINAQTEAAIESTGGAAGVTGKHVEELAGRLEKMTASEAEAVQEGANLLLTFTNIQNKAGDGNKIFDQATSVMNDMSVAMGTDMKSSAMLVGKALNDPIKGMSALSRAGVQFTEGQKATISSLVEGGKTMQAQKIIIKELETQFGGSGEAFAKTAQGQLALLQHRFGEIGESITLKLMPAFLKLLDVGMDVLDWIDDNRRLVGILAVTFGGLAAVLYTVSLAMRAYTFSQQVWEKVTKLAAKAQWLWNAAMSANPLVLVVAAIALVVGALVLFATKTEIGRKITAQLWDGLKSLGSWLMGAGVKAWGAIKAGVEAFAKIGMWMWNTVYQPVFRFLVNGIATILDMWARMLGVLAKVPGFGWAKTAADAMGGAADKARDLAGDIRKIPTHRQVKITADTTAARLGLESFIRDASGRTISIGTRVVATSNRATARAHGGPVHRGRPYLVGEREPELFVPNSSGRILNQRQMAAAGVGGGGSGEVARFEIPVVVDGQVIQRSLLTLKRRNGGLELGIA